MTSIIFLILFPLLPALLVLFTRHGALRAVIVITSVVVIAVPALYLLVGGGGPVPSFLEPLLAIMNRVILFAEIAIALFLTVLGFRSRKFWIPLLAVPPVAFLVFLELFSPHAEALEISASNAFSPDSFSLIMALIVSIVGGLVLIFSLRYMEEYHTHHPDVKNRSNVFFSLFFLFFTAMFGIIFSNNLVRLFFFWEVTTLASFLLIGYSRVPKARKNARTALLFNLLGGLAFTAAIGVTVLSGGSAELSALLAGGNSTALVAAVLLSIAGFTKSAQFPFSSWLKGAMVAPTPVSALLHSSTMVKAGVFLIIKLSPVFSGTVPGFLISLAGAFTFLFAAFIAVSRRMPKVTYLMLIGIAGMFLAPFGMLISKWAALKALVDVHPILAVIMVFGGTATLFFWTKWMGKLTSVRSAGPSVEKDELRQTWFLHYLQIIGEATGALAIRTFHGRRLSE